MEHSVELSDRFIHVSFPTFLSRKLLIFVSFEINCFRQQMKIEYVDFITHREKAVCIVLFFFFRRIIWDRVFTSKQ